MEAQKIINLLDNTENEYSKFATKKWYVIDNESKGNYSKEINETFIDEADFINITMPMYNLIEYSDNYSDTSGSLWNFKRDEIEGDVDLTINNAPSFKYKANLIGDTVAAGENRKKENVKIAVPLKCSSNFWRSLEMPLINCKI